MTAVLRMPREAVASVRAQPVASVLTMLVVAGMVLSVLLTAGRTIGAEQQVLASIDAAGTRSIVIRAEDGAGVRSSALARIAWIDGVEWAGAFSNAIDATNALVTDGTRVPARFAYGDDLESLGIAPTHPIDGGTAYASPSALSALGLVDTVGGITLSDGRDYTMVGELTTPDFLAELEPLVLLPRPPSAAAERVNLVVVIAERPGLVGPVADSVLPLLEADDPSKVTVRTSETLAQLRGLIQDQLGTFSRGLVVMLLGFSGMLVAAVLFGLVMMRRKDFGRRRALGATRSSIVVLLLMQTALLAGLGSLLGIATGLAVLLSSGDPLPDPGFITALGLLAILTPVLAATAPAAVASSREPIRELRVP